MSLRVAVECYADQDLIWVLQRRLRLSVKPHHRAGSGKGDVVNAVLNPNGSLRCGMVDEDPGSAQPGKLAQMREADRTAAGLIVKTQGDRIIYVVAPEFEECFLSSCEQAGIRSAWEGQAPKLRALLATPGGKDHEDFRDELGSLADAARLKRVASLVTDLEDRLRMDFSGLV